MKTWTVCLVILLLAGLVGGGIYLYKDHEYRKVHGRVTEVGLNNFEQEVEKSGDMPLVIYFYDSSSGDSLEQDEAVADFAWDHAGEVKVLKVNLNLDERPENLLLAVVFGVGRTPAFVLAQGDRIVKGANGVFHDRHELERLLEQLSKPEPAAPAAPAGS